ncbi:olfactory receptor 10A7-like [Chrysemys picta bellii]|uniref:olfactory receptor 10A7-like n=1 Tax=Chrysemys picta bellii TaxID=8478 RepID=UPI000388CA21|nr:olfactory receptor 10A7-like [Chrysemys picta bellii]
MSVKNQTSVMEFILLGFSHVPDVLQGLLFVGVGAAYMVILLGNSLIIFITLVDAALHTPMYFFLRNLSFLEICYASVTIPRMLFNLLVGSKAISILGCAAQVYFFHSFGISECFLLLAMAYDRCIAICCPLRYTLIMSRSLCLQMVAVSWAAGSLVSSGHVSSVFTLPYCGPNEIDHFFCDIPPVLKLACADTYRSETELFILIVLLAIVPSFLILVSYSQIISTILKMPSTEGKHKAFSTCSSHLIMVTLFLGTGSVVYLQPKSSSYVESNKLLSLLYTVVTPMLNPIVYGLRNEKLKGALRKSCRKIYFWAGRHLRKSSDPAPLH